MNEPTRLVASADDAGARLDTFLAQRLSIGRAQVKRLLAGGGVRVNGRAAGAGDKGAFLAQGDVIEMASPDIDQVIPEPDAALQVLAEGEGWAVVDKPPGMPVHPLAPGEGGTVLNAAAARWPTIQGVGEGGLRSGVVHRLDVDTSGVLLLALSQAAWERLRLAFAEHHTRKVYRAIVAGRLQRDGARTMDLVIAQHRPARVKVVEAHQRHRPPGTRRCDLAWRVVDPLTDATLVEVELGTGFLHQIRVMLAHLGHPILGDRLYAPPAIAALAPRQMLHAARLELSGIRAHSPDPPDFAHQRTTLQSR